MLLAPQHFQEQSARFAALLAQYAGMGAPFMWGICDLEVDEALLDHRRPSGAVGLLEERDGLAEAACALEPQPRLMSIAGALRKNALSSGFW